MAIYLIFFINYSIMIALPIAIGVILARKRKISWGLFFIGAVTFVFSQIGHLPFNAVVQDAGVLPSDTAVLSNLIILGLFYGLSAGVFEEGARYLTYRFWARDARTWGKGLMLGAGHGGIEAIMIGTLGMLNFVLLAFMNEGYYLDTITDAQMPALMQQLEMFNLPWHMVILGAVERVFAISAHLAMSLLVMQVFIRKQHRWLFFSILWHTGLNATAVVGITLWNAYITELLIGIWGLASIGIIFWLKTPEPVEPEQDPLPAVGSAEPREMAVTADMLDQSRYS